MNREFQTYAAILIGVVAIFSPAQAGTVRYRLDASQKQVVELSNLAGPGACLPDQLTGRVVQRTFDKSGLVVQSFVVEYEDGSRELINVDTQQIQSLSMVDRGWVLRGLQTLLKEGRTVGLKAERCGAAGRFIVLDAITLSTP